MLILGDRVAAEARAQEFEKKAQKAEAEVQRAARQVESAENVRVVDIEKIVAATRGYKFSAKV
jgi:predicted thioesterase